MNYVPNLLTLARIAMVPYLIILMQKQLFMAALCIFFIAGVSDGLDGLIARKFNAKSYAGALMDPVADKFLIVSIFIMFSSLQLIPFWLMLIVVLRDIVIVGGYILMLIFFSKVAIEPLKLSKLNTFLQISFIIVVLVGLAWQLDFSGVLPLLSYLVLFSSLVSGVAYVYLWSKKALNNPQVRVNNVKRQGVNA